MSQMPSEPDAFAEQVVTMLAEAGYDAVDWTMDWYRREADGEAAFDLCGEQIARYESLP